MDIEALGDLIAANLEALLEEIGETEASLARKAKLGHTGVRDIISRKVKHPKYSTLVQIANAVGKDVRKITVGPNFKDGDEAGHELLHLFFQLEPAEQEFLLNSAKAQLASRDPSLQ